MLIVLAGIAWASKTRLRLERIDPTEFASDGKIKIYASIVELEGTVVEDKSAPQFQLRVNGNLVGRPEKMTRFTTSGDPLDVVLVVESSALYGPPKVVAPPPAPPPPRKGPKDKKKPKGPPLPPPPVPKRVTSAEEPLEKVKDAAKALLEAMSPKWRVLVINYGEDVTPHPPFRAPQAAHDAIEELITDQESGDLRLAEAVRAALLELNKPRPDNALARRLIVVVSDGLNSTMDRKVFKSLGDAAAKARVPIHTIAFSANDDRGPLLNLGEIAKRSNGTFRWAKNADDLKNQIETLGEELHKQYVLTFALDMRSLDGKTFELVCEDLVSNPLVYDESGGTIGVPAGAGKRNLPWWLWASIGGGLLLIGLIIFLAKRPKRPQMRFATTRGGQQPQAQAQPQRQAAPQPQAQPQPQRAAQGSLIVISGQLSGQRIPVGAQPLLVGKGPSTLMISDDPTVSTRHAQIAIDRGMFVITDLGSTNGTFVNNQRISQPTRLSDGDLVRFGNTQVKFRIE
jgi:hypothetical protein